MIGTQETIQMEIINLYLCNFLKFIKDKFISCLAFFPKKKNQLLVWIQKLIGEQS